MNQTVRLVRDYYNSGLQRRKLDTDILTVCVDNLSDTDVEFIIKNKDSTLHTGNEQFKFFMNKLLFRYNDIVAGRTKVDQEGCIEFTAASSVMELCDNMTTFKACDACNIKCIRDIKDETVSELPIGVVGHLMAALLLFKVSD